MKDILLPDEGDNIIRTRDLEHEFSKRSLGKVLFEHMKKHKTRVAQIDATTGICYTYGELLEHCIRTALEMRHRSVKKDDIICVISHSQPTCCIPYLAALFIGARICALDPMMSYDDIKHLLNLVPPKMVFTSEASEELLLDIIKELRLEATEIVIFGQSQRTSEFDEFLTPKLFEKEFTPEEIADVFATAIIFFSSGTTGLPKGTCINHYSILQQSAMFHTLNFDLSISLTFTSICWVSSVNVLISSILFGHARLLCKIFDAEQVWYSIDSYKVTMMLLSATQATLLLKSKRPTNLEYENLKHVLVGGAHVSLELFLGLQKAFPNAHVTHGYGWTEVGGIITMSSPNCVQDVSLLKNKQRSCGRPLPGLWYKVVDVESGKIVGPNEKGELHLKTNYQMNGYYNMDSTNAWDREGWIKTGDVCYYDEDYCFYVVDRIKELIKYRGWHVSPALLEGILLKHPAVKMAVVIGVPHEEDNEHPLALVMLTNSNNYDISQEQLKKYVDDKVDEYKKLRAGVKFLSNMPQTPSGKIRRNYLKTQILAQIDTKMR